MKDQFTFGKTIVFIGACIIVMVSFSLVNKPQYFDNQKSFSISYGENLVSVAQRLKQEEYISSGLIFQFYTRMVNKDTEIKAGVYTFSPPLSVKQIVELITDNHTIQKTFLIKPGDTLFDIQKNLQKDKIISANISLEKWQVKDFSKDPAYHSLFQGAPKDASLEGYLFPDSYHLPSGLPEEEMINIFLNNFAVQVSPVYLSSVSREHNFYEILTMASLLEKEVQSSEDKAMIADILWRRLKINMPLQVDAAICYAQDKSFQNCQLTVDSFKIDSPYNLYQYKGLPPTPIGNPGLESIKAALNPQSNDYWYYLTDRETGKTIFSQTFEEHKAARRKYL